MRDRDDLEKLAEAYNSVPDARIKMRRGIGDWTNDQALNEAGLGAKLGGLLGRGKKAVQGAAQAARQGVEDFSAGVAGRDSLSMDPAEVAARDAGFSSVAGKEGEQAAADEPEVRREHGDSRLIATWSWGQSLRDDERR